MLKENNVKDIAISTNIHDYDDLGVEILMNKTEYIHNNPETNLTSKGCWLNAYYLMDKPCCYLHGDVYWSEEALKKVVELEVENTMFICVPDRQDGRKKYNIKGREPLGYKVQNNKIFNNAVNELKSMIDAGKFKRDPISWHLYRKINNIEMVWDDFGNDIFNTKGDFITIDDYTTDIDMARDIPKIEEYLKILKGGIKMVKVEVIKNFHLSKYNELIDIERKKQNVEGYLYIGDIFKCTEEMYEYLTKTNKTGRSFVKFIELIPKKEKAKTTKINSEEKTTKKRTRKSIAKKD